MNYPFKRITWLLLQRVPDTLLTFTLLTAKLQSGKKLSQKEMDYLRKTNPIMYAHALRVQRMAEAVEEQLKHAKSKEEADQIISSALSGISKNDPDREYIFAAVNRISTEFHKSGAYEKLPNTVEEGDKEGKESGDIFSDADDKEDDGFDLKNWSPLREVYDSMPTFSVSGHPSLSGLLQTSFLRHFRFLRYTEPVLLLS